MSTSLITVHLPYSAPSLPPNRRYKVFANETNSFVLRYLLNPYIFLPTLALSTSTFENTLTILSIMFACQRMVKIFNDLLKLIIHYRSSICVTVDTSIPHPAIPLVRCTRGTITNASRRRSYITAGVPLPHHFQPQEDNINVY